MPRAITTVTLALIWTLLAGAGPGDRLRWVDLDTPGALEALAQSNPAHHAKISAILDYLDGTSRGDAERVRRVMADARDVDYSSLILLASYPPKRRLFLTLDTTRYEVTVTATRDLRILRVR